MARKKLSRHKKLARKARQRRHVRHLGRITGNTTVYSAAAWWSDSDPSMQVAGLDKKVVERKIEELMKEEARRAVEDGMHESIDDALEEIHWSGIHAFALKDLTSDRDRDEAIEELQDNGYFYPETP